MSWMKAVQQSILLIAITLLISCTAPNARVEQYAPLPGDAKFYSYGVSQSEENFANIARAQSDYTLYPDRRTWSDDKPGRAPATMGMLQIYYPLHVRWELKDGRQFVLEDIDVAGIMREYFGSNRLELPHQRESRARVEGDYAPSLVHEVKNDAVIIKWFIRNNRTPPERRSKELPQVEDEQYPVIELKGNLTSGIDFNNKREFGRSQKIKN